MKRKKKTKDYLFTLEIISDNETWFLKCENETHLKVWLSNLENLSSDSYQISGNQVFGAPLKVTGIPDVVQQCVKYIEEKALDVVGIFRLSGSSVKIDEYKQAFDRGEKVDLSTEPDPHAVSGLLKLYFRDLPEPILTFNLYDQFITAQMVPDIPLRVRYMKVLLSYLPKINFEILKYLMGFLRNVQAHSEINKMAIHNLATVFGPNLLVPPDNSTFTMIQDTPQINGIVNTLIQEYDSFFTNKITDQIAVALYDYIPLDITEIGFKAGDRISVITKGEDGWWQGEINGRIGRFPGSYVELEIKTKKQQFKEEMASLHIKLEEEKKMVDQLQQSKDISQNEVDEALVESENYKRDTNALKTQLLALIKQNKIDNLLSKIEKYQSKLEAFIKVRIQYEELRVSVSSELDELRNFLSKPPEVAKKNLKPKTVEKVDSLVGILQVKFNAEQKKRSALNDAIDGVYLDSLSLSGLLKE